MRAGSKRRLGALGAALALSLCLAPTRAPGLELEAPQRFLSELDALSWNFLVSLLAQQEPALQLPTEPLDAPPFPLVLLNQDPNPLREPGCGFRNPAGCSVDLELLNDLRPGGNGQFGRRDFLGIWIPDVGIEPIAFGDLICGTSVGLSDPFRCSGPSAAVPEPGGALAFAAGLLVAARRLRRR